MDNQQDRQPVGTADYLKACRSKWRWFAASTAFTLAAGILMLLAVQPKYERTAAILIKDENSGGGLLSSMAASMGMLAGLSGLNISSNVQNELEIIGSAALMTKVVERLGLGTRYQQYDGLMKRDLWQETLPVKVTFPQLTDKDAAYMKMDLRRDGSYTLYKFRKNKDKLGGETEGRAGEVVETPVGKASVIKTKYFDSCFAEKESDEMTIRITKERMYDVTDRMMRRLDAGLADDQASVVEISYEDMSEERAELVLSTLIGIYQEEWLKDKQSEADASTQFIDERIGRIEAELGGLDRNIAEFRGQNLLPDYEEAAKMYMKNVTTTYEAQLKVNNYLYMLQQMREQVRSIEGQNIVLPANLLPDNPNVALEISEYNKLQTKRNAMAANSNGQNPLVQDLDVQLKGMRDAIINSLDQGIAQLKAQQQGVGREDRKLKQEIAGAPGKITQILPAERKQRIVEALYIYLLEKREENNITHVFNAQNLRIVQPPMGDWKPVFPKTGVTLVTAIALGLALPACLIFLLMSLGAWKRA